MRGRLNDFIPEIIDGEPGRRGRSADVSKGPSLVDLTSPSSLVQYDSSFCGRVPAILKQMPEELQCAKWYERWLVHSNETRAALSMWSGT